MQLDPNREEKLQLAAKISQQQFHAANNEINGYIAKRPEIAEFVKGRMKPFMKDGQMLEKLELHKISRGLFASPNLEASGLIPPDKVRPLQKKDIAAIKQAILDDPVMRPLYENLQQQQLQLQQLRERMEHLQHVCDNFRKDAQNKIVRELLDKFPGQKEMPPIPTPERGSGWIAREGTRAASEGKSTERR